MRLRTRTCTTARVGTTGRGALLLALAGIAGLVMGAVPRARAEGTKFQKPTAEKRVQSIETELYLEEHTGTPDANREVRNELLEKLLRKREALVKVRRKEAIRLLERFVRNEPESAPEMPDALLRLAELHWEQSRATYIERFAEWQDTPPKDRSQSPPTPRYGRAIELYDRILKKHRDFSRYDLVLFMKAHAYVETGRWELAVPLHDRIIEEFPDSEFVPDAHMARAEAAFSGSYDYKGALEEYNLVLAHPESGLYDLALFKSAWCLWRLNRTKEAAQRFRKVLDLGDEERRAMTAERRKRLRELQDEALEYLIQVFTEDEENSADDVFRFLEEIGGEHYAYRVLTRLSDTYAGQARFDRAVQAYRLLIGMDPSSPDAPKFQYEIADAYAQMGEDKKAVDALLVLAEKYRRGTEWSKQQSDPEAIDRGERLGERSLRKQAKRWHELGQKDKDKEKFERAEAIYASYLEYFGDSKHAYEMSFYRAEILFHRLERYSEAGEAYLETAKLNPKGEFTRDSLYNAIGAFERVREKELEQCQREEDSECKESPNDQQFSEAIELYVELFPRDKDIPEILFRQGRLYYDRKIYDPAVRLWGQLLEKYPKSKFAGSAGELILDSFNRAKDYENIDKWARRLKKAPAFRSTSAQRRLDGLILQAAFKTGEQLAERGKHERAASAYAKAADEFPNDPRAKKALFNAGLEYQRAGDLTTAVDTYGDLIERYPGSEEGAKGAWRAAQVYESIALFRDAARYYESYATKFPNQPKAKDAAYNATLLRSTAGDYKAAVRNGNRYMRKYSSDPTADEVAFLMGSAYESEKRWNDASRVYKRFVKSTKDNNKKVEGLVGMAKSLRRSGNKKGASTALDQALKLAKRRSKLSDQGLYHAAQARYMQGEEILAQYEAIKIAGSTKGLRKRLQRKSELLRDASLVFSDVVKFRVAEWVTASLFQIGRSYELFAEGMRNAPVPEGLNEAQEQSYQDQLAMFIVPMEERALEAYEGGYQKALELRIYNRWTQKLHEALTRLNDVQYPPLREIGGAVVTGGQLQPPDVMVGLQSEAE